ncbi:MAG: conjugal transfer protein TraD [Leptolyngbya sp. SIO3F4]|nr:conjugal transfer protein TraD [Leptolyngbya sp. SIO3F4]
MTDGKIKEQIQRIEQRMEADRQKVFTLKAKEKEQQRKARTRRLIELGGLVEIAGLTEIERGALLGLLLENRDRLQDEATYRNLKQLGNAELNRRAQTRKTTKKNPKGTTGQAA